MSEGYVDEVNLFSNGDNKTLIIFGGFIGDGLVDNVDFSSFYIGELDHDNSYLKGIIMIVKVEKSF